MREIKFRAWDKENSEMIYSDNVGNDYYFVITDKSVLCVMDVSYDDSFGLPTTSLSEIDEVMQYTGLKDKNGKEIYEGDIVDFRQGERILYILFNNGQWNLCQYLNEPDKDYRHLSYYINHDGPIEVIGNIYENPELLES